MREASLRAFLSSISREAYRGFLFALLFEQVTVLPRIADRGNISSARALVDPSSD